MKELVKKEVLKPLKVVVIYPVHDSEWVSPVQVVLKKVVVVFNSCIIYSVMVSFIVSGTAPT
jgi:hypothetical protein